jgi:hypothetical protein
VKRQYKNPIYFKCLFVSTASVILLFSGVIYAEKENNVLSQRVGFQYTLPCELCVGSNGEYFCIDQKPVFLNGVSYYGGCTITTNSFIINDLDDMLADGFNWIRIWVYWKYPVDTGEDVSVMTHDGQIRKTYMDRLKHIITECRNRGIIVDCTLNRDGNGDWVGPRNQTEHLAAVQNLATELLNYRNVYFDLANERDVSDDRYVNLIEVGQLVDAVKAIDPNRLCTVSGTPSSDSELNNYKTIGKVDFIAPHLCRDEGCSSQTYSTVKNLIEQMDNLGFRIPIHIQEPFRRGYASYNPTVEDFYRDCTGAKVAEAAGWCLHNGNNSGDAKPWRCFNMSDSEGRLYSQLDSIELEVVDNINEQIGSTDPNVRRYQSEYSEQLAHLVGQKDNFSWSANTSSYSAGYLSYGPYLQTLPSGIHQAKWRLMIDNNISDNNVVATIDVVRHLGQETLVSHQIKREDFTAENIWQDFTLYFADNTSDDIEFRTYWHGNSNIKIDWITLNIGYEPILVSNNAKTFGDFNFDSSVTIEDLAIIVSQWLEESCLAPGWCGWTDADTDGSVNFTDFALFSDTWKNTPQILPPGCVQGDVVSYSYVPNKNWGLQGYEILPYLCEYGLMQWDDYLEDFHAENIRRIDIASQWSTAIMLYARESTWRDEMINLMIRCFKNRQLIILRNYWKPGEPDTYANTVDILETLWASRDIVLTNPEGDQATGRQLINNIMCVGLGDENECSLGKSGLQEVHQQFYNNVKYRWLDGQQPFTHIKAWYNMIGYANGCYAATQDDVNNGRILLPSNLEFIGVDTYHYWSLSSGIDPIDPNNYDDVIYWSDYWQDVMTKYYPEGLSVSPCGTWQKECYNDTHALLSGLSLAGANNAIMFFIGNSSNIAELSYTTPVETMNAYYNSLKAGPWVGLSWWLFDGYNDMEGTIRYIDKTLVHYTPGHPGGIPYTQEQLDKLHDDFVASRTNMFCDVVYNQFGYINIPPVIAEVNPFARVAHVGKEYTFHLNLLQGNYNPNWTILEGPVELQITPDGLLQGWVPALSQAGQTFTISVKAENLVSDHQRSWQIEAILP